MSEKKMGRVRASDAGGDIVGVRPSTDIREMRPCVAGGRSRLDGDSQRATTLAPPTAGGQHRAVRPDSHCRWNGQPEIIADTTRRLYTRTVARSCQDARDRSVHSMRHFGFEGGQPHDARGVTAPVGIGGCWGRVGHRLSVRRVRRGSMVEAGGRLCSYWPRRAEPDRRVTTRRRRRQGRYRVSGPIPQTAAARGRGASPSWCGSRAARTAPYRLVRRPERSRAAVDRRRGSPVTCLDTGPGRPWTRCLRDSTPERRTLVGSWRDVLHPTGRGRQPPRAGLTSAHAARPHLRVEGSRALSDVPRTASWMLWD